MAKTRPRGSATAIDLKCGKCGHENLVKWSDLSITVHGAECCYSAEILTIFNCEKCNTTNDLDLYSNC